MDRWKPSIGTYAAVPGPSRSLTPATSRRASVDFPAAGGARQPQQRPPAWNAGHQGDRVIDKHPATLSATPRSRLLYETKNPQLTPELYAYVLDHNPPLDPVQRELVDATHAQLPDVAGLQTAEEQGPLLAFLVRLTGARQIVEVGTFTGFSTLSMAQALPADGRLIACDVSEEWTAVGREAWAKAGVADRIDLRIAPALDTLRALPAAVDRPGLPRRGQGRTTSTTGRSWCRGSTRAACSSSTTPSTTATSSTRRATGGRRGDPRVQRPCAGRRPGGRRAAHRRRRPDAGPPAAAPAR